MRPPLVLPLLLASLAAGCAHVSQPDAVPFPQEQVHARPLGAALPGARALLEERGYTVLPDAEPTRLLTEWRTPPADGASSVAPHRYHVVGIRVSAWQSVVRIFKTERGALVSTRDLDLERELRARLASLAPGEVQLGHLVQDEASRPPTRDGAFYLERWKHTEPALDALCPRRVRGLRDLLRPGATLLVGEQLGSREAPTVVGDMVCEVTDAGLPLALGLSIPREEQERLEAYLASAGAPADQDELLRGVFWMRPYQDGRSSWAILDLLDRVRALRALGRFVSVVAYDANENAGSERDALMADVWLKRRAQRPEEVFLVLSGNVHVRTEKGTPWDAGFVPMGWHLRNADPTLKAFDMSYARGRRWGCDLDEQEGLRCNIIHVSPSKQVAERPGLSPYLRLFSEPSSEGYHGLLYVGALTPSMPATALSRAAEEPPRPTNIRPPAPPPKFFTPPAPRNPRPSTSQRR
jgi:hypothetical protein